MAGEQARTKNMYLRITLFSISPSFWDTVPLVMVKLLKKYCGKGSLKKAKDRLALL